jgi:hypothetical protein
MLTLSSKVAMIHSGLNRVLYSYGSVYINIVCKDALRYERDIDRYVILRNVRNCIFNKDGNQNRLVGDLVEHMGTFLPKLASLWYAVLFRHFTRILQRM